MDNKQLEVISKKMKEICDKYKVKIVLVKSPYK